MEDDIVTAPGFLKFMNEALEFYKDDDAIISITGYCPPIEIPDDYKEDVFILPRLNGWGTGFIWKNMKKFHIQIDKQEFKNI